MNLVAVWFKRRSVAVSLIVSQLAAWLAVYLLYLKGGYGVTVRRVARVFVDLRKFSPKVINTRWLEQNDLKRVVTRLVRLLGFTPTLWLILSNRILRLWRLGGSKFLISYLKECRLALIAWANHTPYPRNPGVRVRLTPSGLPRIIPSGLRPGNLGYFQHRLLFRGLHTVFNLYRVMDWTGAMPDLSSITRPFTGVSQVLFDQEIRNVLSLFPKVRQSFGTVAPWVSTSAGPNHPWSTWSAGVDVLAWALNPVLLYWYCVFAYCTNQRLLALWLGVLAHILFPVAVLLRLRNVTFKLGRLAVLAKDGGGKRRIVGIVDFWSQWLLKSLHLYLFDVLRRIPQDGTFDQTAPLRALLDYARLGYPCFSFDLSNATDRLPVLLQEQILSILTGSRFLAKAWRYLMVARGYCHENQDIRYAVGQPMGALSSWAILAFTHHVIVQVAAYRTGFKGFYPFYAVLGDDVVILGRAVAEEYLSIIRYLGVPINLGKSIRSESGLIEFARRVVSAHHGDLSPVSGRELLRSVRQPRLIADLLVHALNLGIVRFPREVRNVIERLRPMLNRKGLRGMVRPMIIRAFVLRRFEGVSRNPSPALLADNWFPSLLGSHFPVSVLKNFEVEIWAETLVSGAGFFNPEREIRHTIQSIGDFIHNWIRFPVLKGTLGGFVSWPLILFTPAFWSYIRIYWEGLHFYRHRILTTAVSVVPPWFKPRLAEALVQIRDPLRHDMYSRPRARPTVPSLILRSTRLASAEDILHNAVQFLNAVDEAWRGYTQFYVEPDMSFLDAFEHSHEEGAGGMWDPARLHPQVEVLALPSPTRTVRSKARKLRRSR